MGVYSDSILSYPPEDNYYPYVGLVGATSVTSPRYLEPRDVVSMFLWLMQPFRYDSLYLFEVTYVITLQLVLSVMNELPTKPTHVMRAKVILANWVYPETFKQARRELQPLPISSKIG